MRVRPESLAPTFKALQCFCRGFDRFGETERWKEKPRDLKLSSTSCSATPASRQIAMQSVLPRLLLLSPYASSEKYSLKRQSKISRLLKKNQNAFFFSPITALVIPSSARSMHATSCSILGRSSP